MFIQSDSICDNYAMSNTADATCGTGTAYLPLRGT
jgi:hypothetical protein